MKYIVEIRQRVEDWEIPSDIWDDLGQEPYIEADSPEEAEKAARDYIQDCDDDPDKYEYRVTEYEDEEG